VWWLQADNNPQDNLLSTTELTAFLTSKGVPAGTIAYYGFGTGNIQHVAKKAGGSGTSCLASSKLGPGLRTSHDLSELEDGTYGNIVGGN
jgi:hypothetical protein